ncbi:hypothetical protein FRG77_08110 [Listeria monocytogenes]|uniref:Uncharacterized protein n=1 Tax=Listeria monocytogenes TaxID=1639 RepID=A0A9P1T8R6_LISMN|nr:hypothetical protein [Listeria monocytogenes]EAC2288968.1 hypothetical protein [Listeria monocytogenes]EAC2302902.1 hypothetical protein [Listeria monocytogenes]EAC5549410.1 hypothetical protein [Listeria monocytogenes]EAC5748235.1 hypothetical protein [Listeria monocytogenes]EAC7929663.1 hypothetical protein [Listeria monocytogenes]
MTLEIISLTFAAISLGTSIWITFINRKRIKVYFDNNIRIIDGNVLTLINNDGQTDNYGPGYLCSIKILNPSPNDIAYFDLRAFPTETNINSYLLTAKSLHPEFKQARVYEVYSNEQSINELEIPEKNHGIIKANSFTHFDIFIANTKGNEITSEVAISFKVPKIAFFRDPYAVTERKKFKFYGIKYNVNGPKNQVDSKEQQ